MTAKEQGTAVKLLADWLAASEKLRSASERQDIPAAVEAAIEIEELERKTRLFIHHEESSS